MLCRLGESSPAALGALTLAVATLFFSPWNKQVLKIKVSTGQQTNDIVSFIMGQTKCNLHDALVHCMNTIIQTHTHKKMKKTKTKTFDRCMCAKKKSLQILLECTRCYYMFQTPFLAFSKLQSPI